MGRYQHGFIEIIADKHNIFCLGFEYSSRAESSNFTLATCVLKVQLSQMKTVAACRSLNVVSEFIFKKFFVSLSSPIDSSGVTLPMLG